MKIDFPVDISAPPPRIRFLDNTKVFLISLVVLHHLAISLGTPGVWYIKERMTGSFSSEILTLFVSLNQAFFMSLFFYIAGYHSWASLKRYGTGRFMIKRLVRLGIPLLVYDLLINPAIVIFLCKTQMTPAPKGADLIEIVKRFLTVGSGPAWFLERLLVFSFFLILYMYFFRPADSQTKVVMQFREIIWPFSLILVLAAAQFIIKTYLPPPKELVVAGINFPFSPPRYIAMFVIGIWAARYSILEKITLRGGFIWLTITIVVTLSLYGYVKPIVYDNAVGSSKLETIFLFALWENTLAVGLSITTLVLFREWLNNSSKFSEILGQCTFAVYMCHAPILVSMAFLFPVLPLSTLARFVIFAPIALILSFILGRLLLTISQLTVKKISYA